MVLPGLEVFHFDFEFIRMEQIKTIFRELSTG